MRSHSVAFALQAKASALNARLGRSTQKDRLDLAINALRNVPADVDAREAVVAFLEVVAGDPARAGDELEAFLETWMRETIPAPTVSVVRFDWQDRADIA